MAVPIYEEKHDTMVNEKICPGCKQPVRPNVEFCPICGRQLNVEMRSQNNSVAGKAARGVAAGVAFSSKSSMPSQPIQQNLKDPNKKNNTKRIIGIVAAFLVFATVFGYSAFHRQQKQEEKVLSNESTYEEGWDKKLEKANEQLSADLANHQYDWIYGTWDINGDLVRIDKDYVYLSGEKKPFELYCTLDDPYCDELDYGIYTYINGVPGAFVDKSMQTLYAGNEFFTYPCEIVSDGTLSATNTNTTSQNEQSIAGNTYTVNGISFVMKEVKGGSFKMGGNDTQWEGPVHSVSVNSFNIGETEVTQGLWNAVMGSNPSRYQGNDLPVENVSYNDIVNEFLPRLNKMTGKNFRLPTEAEWEFAARGGNNSNGYQYAGSNNLDNIAWYWKNTGDNYLNGTDDDWDWNTITDNNGGTKNVKGKSPNELGIYGMSGNVWEWCSDEWHSYKSASENNPKYEGNNKSSRVLRGGCWCSRTGDCRVTFRTGKKPDDYYPKFGFRIALDQ